jgi:hypothetical protein
VREEFSNFSAFYKSIAIGKINKKNTENTENETIAQGIVIRYFVQHNIPYFF